MQNQNHLKFSKSTSQVIDDSAQKSLGLVDPPVHGGLCYVLQCGGEGALVPQLPLAPHVMIDVAVEVVGEVASP